MKKLSLIALVILVVAVIVGYLYLNQPNLPEVDVEVITTRDLKAIVSATGTIQPKLSVDMSASMMGRVTRLAVEEGDRVRTGQFLLQIDPENLKAAVNRGEASLEASRASRSQTRVNVETARVNLDLARENLGRQQELWSLRLIAREVYDQAVAEVELRETELRAREVDVEAATQRIQQEQATLDSARYDLTQVTITSPIDGIVTRRNIEEGETVVIGTMNNAGTVLLTIADFSVLEAELEVDETDIPNVTFKQAAEITIDALPDGIHLGQVTEIGNSPIQDNGQTTANQEATNFKVVITLNNNVPSVRPGFTCTAEITTATRSDVVSVPIQATTVREVKVGFNGQEYSNLSDMPSRSPQEDSIPGDEYQEEQEGVFVVQEGLAVFIPVQTGIAGERYFEVLNGLAEGDRVITGPFDVVRNLQSGDPVAINSDTSDQANGLSSSSRGGFRLQFGR